MTENEWKKGNKKQLKHPSKGWITIAQDQITRESFEIKYEEMRDGSTLLVLYAVSTTEHPSWH